MSNTFFHILGLGLIIINILLVLAQEQIINDNKDDHNFIEKLEEAKRKLIEKEQKYFQRKPMSDNLKDFILRVKKDRIKRYYDAPGMDDFKAMDFSEFDNLKISQPTISTTSPLEDYNNSDIFRTYTFKPIAITSRSINELPNENQNDLWAQFTFQPSNVAIPVRRAYKESKTKKEAVDSIMENLNPDDTPSPMMEGGDPPQSIALPFVATPAASYKPQANLGRDQVDPEPDQDNDRRTTDDSKVLGEILRDIEGLMEWKNEGKKRDNMICTVDGTWISEVGGVNLVVLPRGPQVRKFAMQIEDKLPPGETGFLCSGNWSLVGEMPFNNSGVVVVLAKHEKDKHVATFIGECRVCDAAETVTGTWLLGRSSRDCKDEKASHQVLSDVWKRENVKDLRTKHLRAINAKDIKP